MKDWTKDPDQILEVALDSVLWDPQFAERLVARIADWVSDKPRLREQLRESLMAGQAGRPALDDVEYAAALARYNDLVRLGGLSSSAAIERLAGASNVSEKAFEARLTKARKLLRNGALERWRAALEPPK